MQLECQIILAEGSSLYYGKPLPTNEENLEYVFNLTLKVFKSGENNLSTDFCNQDIASYIAGYKSVMCHTELVSCCSMGGGAVRGSEKKWHIKN